MTQLQIYQIDTFTRVVFRGNPAAVCPLDEWLDDVQLQAIAAENNLSETAFFVPQDDHYHLRWFTPTHEVPLCGHATLAAAFVILTRFLPAENQVTFETQSGTLQVTRDGDCFTLDLPRAKPTPCEPPLGLVAGLGRQPVEVLITRRDPNYYAIYEREEDIWALAPDLPLLAGLHPFGVAATAPGRSVDFVSRYFAPGYGIPEDPVTGSIHRVLAPYWARRLDRHSLHARQLSKRQGDLFCQVAGNRVLVAGHAVQYLAGTIVV
jgi:predicted PhzF superfamily epimerase YddE/YHI9